MKFSHTADCHIGGHRNPKLRTLTEDAFEQFVSNSIEDEVDFCIIAGDLLNTAVPGIDTLKFTVTQLSRLKEANIPVYAIAGSHDYSPSGKSMLDVFEKAGLLVNVGCEEKIEYTKDEKTGVLLTGIPGKRGMLDMKTYEALQHEPPTGKAIFLFHTAIDGCGMPGMKKELLPEGFTYYAGGHVHVKKDLGSIVYPGPLFPNSFSELEELQHGGYILYDNGTITRKEIKLKIVVPIHIDITGLSAVEANEKLKSTADVTDSIVLVRIDGTLSSGSITDLSIQEFVGSFQSPYVVLRNTAGIVTNEFTSTTIRESSGDLEAELIEEHKEQLTINEKDGTKLAAELLHVLSAEPNDGERQYEYEERVLTEARKTTELK